MSKCRAGWFYWVGFGGYVADDGLTVTVKGSPLGSKVRVPRSALSGAAAESRIGFYPQSRVRIFGQGAELGAVTITYGLFAGHKLARRLNEIAQQAQTSARIGSGVSPDGAWRWDGTQWMPA